ncbi:hypothetical protein ABPG77_007048 [Micractinium sp. CCAP 211/92]
MKITSMLRSRGVWALLALLAAFCATAQAAAAPEGAPPPAPLPAPVARPVGSQQPAAELSLAEQQYQQAVELRDLQDATQKELRHAVKLLYSAAGIQHLSMARTPPAPPAPGAPGAPGQSAVPGFLTAAAVRLELRNDTTPHLGALKELVYVYREGDGVPVNPAIAHRLLLLLAELGHPEAQADIAFHLALGIEPVAPNPRDQLFRLVAPDPAAALVHYAFAAQAGDPVAQMSLGYRHLHGIDVPRSCQTAALYYAPVAEKVTQSAQLRDGLPEIEPIKLSHKTAHSRRGLTSEQEMLHYQWFADFGNVDAAREAARLLAHGSAADHEQAVKYLLQAADAGDSDAMAHLGNMYANGHGVPQDNATALSWLRSAADLGNPAGYLGMGYMYMAGHGVERDYSKAISYLTAAGGQQTGYGRMSGRMRDVRASALFLLGQMHLKGWGTPAAVKQAAQQWEAASKLGHLLAAYNLAMLHLGGQTGGGGGACAAAVALLKGVAERGFPAQQEANDDFQAGDYEWALLNYLKAAEMGVEAGQSNAAWMLTEGYGYEGGAEAGRAALLLYKRSAAQGNHGALLRIGDSYWYGKGVARDWRRAAQMYHEAGRHASAQALFNQGFMHQFGAGLDRDLHLAKRYYDDALKRHPDAELPVQLALRYLRLQQWWEGVQHRLPPKWATVITATLFTVTEKGPAMHGPTPHLSPARGNSVALWAARLRRLVTFDFLFDTLDSFFDSRSSGDNVDLSVAMALLLVLGLVLWRRRTLRQNQARQFVQAGVPAVVPQWLQEHQRQQQQEQQQGPAAASQPAAAPGAAASGPAAPAGSSSGEAASSSGAAGSSSGSRAPASGDVAEQQQAGGEERSNTGAS